MSIDQPFKIKITRAWRGPVLFVIALLAVELLDELIYGVQGGALPLIRDDLRLTYTQIGLLLTLPYFLSSILDPLIGLLGDMWRRKVLIVGGAAMTLLAMLLIGLGHTFAALIVAFCLSYPASTAYVALSQATLMDLHPGRHDQMMARWTVLGAVGQFVGPVLVTLALTLGFGWRGLYFGLACLAGVVTLYFWRWTASAQFGQGQVFETKDELWAGLRDLPRAIHASGLIRWLVLLELADLMLDVFYSFCALYFTDVVHVSPALAGVAVAVLTLGGLLGDTLLIPLLEKFDGLRLIRLTALLALIVYPCSLLVPNIWFKLGLLAVLGPLRSGWYQVLQGRAYSSIPGRSGTVVAIASIGGLVTSMFPLILGTVAEHFGLGWAMALLIIAPISLLIGLPKVDR